MAHLFSFIAKTWEKILFIAAAILCLFLCSLATMYITELPEQGQTTSRKLAAAFIFPWKSIQDSFWAPAVPEVAKANPFVYVLSDKRKGEAKPDTPPESKTKDKQEPAQADKTAASTPPKAPAKEPAKPAAASPAAVMTVFYKGFYVDVNGNPVALLSIQEPGQKNAKNLMSKNGNELAGGFRQTNATSNNVTFVDVNGNLTTISWNTKHDFPIAK